MSKPTLFYYKITVVNPSEAQGRFRLHSAVTKTNIPGQEPLEMWKPCGLETIPPPGCEIETGPKTGYSRIEAVYIRERENKILICISLEDDFRNSKSCMQDTGWKVWEPGDIENLENGKKHKA